MSEVQCKYCYRPIPSDQERAGPVHMLCEDGYTNDLHTFYKVKSGDFTFVDERYEQFVINLQDDESVTISKVKMTKAAFDALPGE